MNITHRLAADMLRTTTAVNVAFLVQDTHSIAAVTNVLVAFPGIAESAKAQTVFLIPNVRREYTDHVARRARCAVRGHDEVISEEYGEGRSVFTCQCCYREQVRSKFQ